MSKLMALAGAAFVLVYLGLLWPIADMLFAAHMTQHLLLIALAAPLLVLGGVDTKLPPMLGWGLFVSIFLFWHWPAAFQWAARNPATQLLELATILGAAIAFWSGALGHNKFNDGARALLVMTAAVLTDLPGVVMMFAPRAICVMPGEDAARFEPEIVMQPRRAVFLHDETQRLRRAAFRTFRFRRCTEVALAHVLRQRLGSGGFSRHGRAPYRAEGA